MIERIASLSEKLCSWVNSWKQERDGHFTNLITSSSPVMMNWKTSKESSFQEANTLFTTKLNLGFQSLRSSFVRSTLNTSILSLLVSVSDTSSLLRHWEGKFRRWPIWMGRIFILVENNFFWMIHSLRGNTFKRCLVILMRSLIRRI